MTDWQAIETAPKDGSVILCYCGRGVDLWYWSDERYSTRPRPYFKRVRQMSVGHDRGSKLTHWMPLPEPPHG